MFCFDTLSFVRNLNRKISSQSDTISLSDTGWLFVILHLKILINQLHYMRKLPAYRSDMIFLVTIITCRSIGWRCWYLSAQFVFFILILNDVDTSCTAFASLCHGSSICLVCLLLPLLLLKSILSGFFTFCYFNHSFFTSKSSIIWLYIQAFTILLIQVVVVV